MKPRILAAPPARRPRRASRPPRRPCSAASSRSTPTRTDQQIVSSVAADHQGNFVITWTDEGQDYDIFARRIDANANPLAAPFPGQRRSPPVFRTVLRSARTPRESSSWSGRTPAPATASFRVSSAGGSTRTPRRSVRISRSTRTRPRRSSTPGSPWRPPAHSSPSGRAISRMARTSGSSDSDSTRPALRWEPSSPSTPTRRAARATPASRSRLPADSSSCGTARARTARAPASPAAATTTPGTRLPSFRSTPTRRDSSLRPTSGCMLRRKLRRRPGRRGTGQRLRRRRPAFRQLRQPARIRFPGRHSGAQRAVVPPHRRRRRGQLHRHLDGPRPGRLRTLTNAPDGRQPGLRRLRPAVRARGAADRAGVPRQRVHHRRPERRGDRRRTRTESSSSPGTSYQDGGIPRGLCAGR